MLTVREGDFIDSVSAAERDAFLPPAGFLWRQQRPGTYRVSVSRAGYRRWDSSNIRIDRIDPCSVRPVSLIALLARETQ
jgi:hypothetical protein